MGVSVLWPASTSGVMGKSLVGVVVMGEPRLGGLQYFDRLSFGAESATGREPVPTTASAPASPEAAPLPVIAEMAI
jgi:hypothetical protein